LTTRGAWQAQPKKEKEPFPDENLLTLQRHLVFNWVQAPQHLFAEVGIGIESAG